MREGAETWYDIQVTEEFAMAAKTKVSLSVDSDILARARAKKIDLDELIEHALRRYGCEDPEISESRARKWREDNRGAVEQCNRHIEKHGMWWEGLGKAQKPKRQIKKPAKRTHAR